MQEILKTMMTPVWLISTVLTGLLLNLLSGYLKDAIDNIVGRLTKRAARKREHRMTERMETVIRLGTDPQFNRHFRVRSECDLFIGGTLLFWTSFFLVVFVVHTTSASASTHYDGWSAAFDFIFLLLMAASGLAAFRFLGRRFMHKVMLVLAEGHQGIPTAEEPSTPPPAREALRGNRG